MARKEAAKQITIEDLKRVDIDKARAEVEELEGKLAAHVETAQREIDGRKAFIKAIEVLIHGKPARKAWGSNRKTADPDTGEPSTSRAPGPRPAAAPLKPPKPAASTASDDEAAPRRQGRPSHADRIADVLKQRGKLAARDIAKALGLSEESARHHLQNDERFDVDGVGLWELL